MTRLCLIALTALWPLTAAADMVLSVGPVNIDTLDDLRWQARPVVVLGPAPQVAAQIAALQPRAGALAERDVVLLTDGPGAVAFGDGTGFQVLLIGKDGGVKLRDRRPITADRIIALIDTMPMRRREAR